MRVCSIHPPNLQLHGLKRGGMGQVSGHREGWQDTGPTLRPKVPSLRPLPLLLGDLSVVESQPQEPRPGSGGSRASPTPQPGLAWGHGEGNRWQEFHSLSRTSCPGKTPAVHRCSVALHWHSCLAGGTGGLGLSGTEERFTSGPAVLPGSAILMEPLPVISLCLSPRDVPGPLPDPCPAETP